MSQPELFDVETGEVGQATAHPVEQGRGEPETRGWAWCPYGDVAAELFAPDGTAVGLIGVHTERRLQYVRTDPNYRKGLTDAQLTREEEGLAENHGVHAVWAQRIVDAMNRDDRFASERPAPDPSDCAVESEEQETNEAA